MAHLQTGLLKEAGSPSHRVTRRSSATRECCSGRAVGCDFLLLAETEEFIRFDEDGDYVNSVALCGGPFALGVLLPLIESKRKRFTVVQDFPHKRILFASIPWRKAWHISTPRLSPTMVRCVHARPKPIGLTSARKDLIKNWRKFLRFNGCSHPRRRHLSKELTRRPFRQALC